MLMNSICASFLFFAKALKVWQRLSQEKAIPLSRFGELLKCVIIRLGDVSWTVVRSAVQLVKSILENNPFGAKVKVPIMDIYYTILKCVHPLNNPVL